MIVLAHNVEIRDIPSSGYGITSTGTSAVPFIPVAIDIRPGPKDPPRIEIGGGDEDETIQVAIFSTPTFSAISDVDTSSLTFGSTGTEQSLESCRSRQRDKDGSADLICKFYLRKTGFKAGDTQGILEGLTVDRQLIKGKDSIRVLRESDLE